MKRRYSPAARRAHLAHLRAKYRQPIMREVATTDPLPGDPKYPMFDFIRQCHQQVSYVAQGLVTMREMADNIQWMVERWEIDTAPATSCELPHRVQPEPDPKPVEFDSSADEITPHTRYVRVSPEVNAEEFRQMADFFDMGVYGDVRILRWKIGPFGSERWIDILAERGQIAAPPAPLCYHTFRDAVEGIDRGTSWQRRNRAIYAQQQQPEPAPVAPSTDIIYGGEAEEAEYLAFKEEEYKASVQTAEEWAATLTPPSPPWEGGAA